MGAATKKSTLTPAEMFADLIRRKLKPVAIHGPGIVRKVGDAPTTGKEPHGTQWGLKDWVLEDFLRADRHCRELGGVGASIGVLLGPGKGPDGSWLVDLEGDEDGAEESRATLLGGELIETMGWSSVRGSHQLYTAEESKLAPIMAGLKGSEAKDEAGKKKTGVYKLASLPGLELRLGGYKSPGIVKQIQSVCPPSPGTDGKPRTWTGPDIPTPLPDEFYRVLAELCRPEPRPEPRIEAAAAIDGLKATAIDAKARRDQAWTRKTVDSMLAELAGTPEGGRNNALNRIGFRLAQLVPHYLNRADLERNLRVVAEAIGLPSGEVDRTVASCVLDGMADPRYRRDTPDEQVGPKIHRPDDPEAEPEEAVNESRSDPHRLARIYLDARHRHEDGRTLVYHNGEFHRWNTAYRPMTVQEIRAALTTSIKSEYDRLNRADIARWKREKSEEPKPLAAKVATKLVNDVVGALAGESLLDGPHAAPCWLGPDGPFPADEILPTKNALLHLPSFAAGMTPHLVSPTPRFFCPYATDYDFDEAAPSPAHWLDFLRRIWPDDPDSVTSLQEWFGYHLTPDTSQEKIGMLIGPKRSGKGTIAKVLTAMIGESNVCNPKCSALGLPFGLESLIGKMAAIITDARITSRTDIAQVVENLLTISGTDRQTIARKHKVDWSGNLPTKFTIISNELPRLADASGALPSRMIIFQFKQSFYNKEDTKLFAKIRPEMPGILLWAVEGWKRLRDRGRLAQPESGRQLVEEMEELSSPIGVFIRERCIVEAGRQVLTTDLFEEWKRWCESMGRREHGDLPSLGRNLRSVLPALETKQCRIGNGRGRFYMGIDLANQPQSGSY